MFDQSLTRKQKKFYNLVVKALIRVLKENQSWLGWNDAYSVLAAFNVRLTFTTKAKGKKK